MIPTDGMLGVHFAVRFFMDLVGVLSILGWSIRCRSGFCPVGISRGLFSIFGVRNKKIFLIFPVSKILARVFLGSVCGDLAFIQVHPLWGEY